jgi:hypothetical protein
MEESVGALQIVDDEDEVLVLVKEPPENLDAAFAAVRSAAERIERSASSHVEVAVVIDRPLSAAGRFLVRALALQAEARGKTVRIWPARAAS